MRRVALGALTLVAMFAAAEPVFDLAVPIQGLTIAALHDMYNEVHSGHPHEAIDIMEPRGTPVHAVVNGTVQKLFLSKPGGNTIYEFGDDRVHCYYYAHLDRYAEGLQEQQRIKRGEVIGYVGTSGNANPGAPHLHFAIFELGPARQWWKGKPINPYASLVQAVKRGQ